MINAFSFVSDMTAKVLSHGHVFVYRNMPRLLEQVTGWKKNILRNPL